MLGTIAEIEGTESDADHCGSKLSAVLVFAFNCRRWSGGLRSAVPFCNKQCLPPERVIPQKFLGSLRAFERPS